MPQNDSIAVMKPNHAWQRTLHQSLLMLRTGSHPSGRGAHDLKALCFFERLPGDIQARIRRYFAMQAEDDIRRKTLEPFGLEPERDLFDWCLEASKDAFEGFRYVVRSRAVKPAFFPNIESIMKGLRDSFENPKHS